MATTFQCPLCGSTISGATYDKVTGIWQERRKQLEEIGRQRKALRERFREGKLKLKEQLKRFKQERAGLIKQAVAKKTQKLNSQMEELRSKQAVIEQKADKRIQETIAKEHERADRKLQLQMKQFKASLKVSTQGQLRAERKKARDEAAEKYSKLQYSFDSAIKQMKAKASRIKEQQEQIRELERQLKRHTTPSLEGLLYEKTLLEHLKKRFPEDEFIHTGKGGDIIHNVRNNGECSGTIVYECKRVKNYALSHVLQAWRAKESRKADYVILVTNAMKKGTQGFYVERGVLIVHPAGVISLMGVIRTQIVQISDMKLGQKERDEATRLTLEYLQGPEFSNSIEGVIGETIALYKDLREEIKKHIATWKKRADSYKKIHYEASKIKGTTHAVLSGQSDYESLQIPPPPELAQLPLIDS